MDFFAFQTATASDRSGRVLAILIRLAALAVLGAVLLAIVLIGFFVVLPLVLAGSIVSYFYLRSRVRRAQRRPPDGVIDAEYTIIDQR